MTQIQFISFLNWKETKHITWIYLSSNPVDTPKVVHILLISAQDSIIPKYLGLDPVSMVRILRPHSSHWLRSSEQSFHSRLQQFTAFCKANQAHVIKSRLIWTMFPFFLNMCSSVHLCIWKQLLAIDCPRVFSPVTWSLVTGTQHIRCGLASQYPTEQPLYRVIPSFSSFSENYDHCIENWKTLFFRSKRNKQIWWLNGIFNRCEHNNHPVDQVWMISKCL